MSDRQNRLFFFSRRRQGDLPPLIRVDPRTLAYFGVILVLVGLAGWLYLHQASQVALYAHEIRQLQQDKERLRREIIALRAEVAQYGALQRVMDAAHTKGYSLPSATDRTRLVILDVPVPEPTAESALGGARTPAKAGDGQLTFWQQLWEQFRAWLSPSEQDQGAGRKSPIVCSVERWAS